jgi:hypothetical protein
MVEQWNFRQGDEVYGGDGGKVGKIVSVRPNFLVVEKGFFFSTDYYIPVSAVSTYESNKIYLTVSKDEALNQGWDKEPVDESMVDPATMGAAPTNMQEPMGTMPPPDDQRPMDRTSQL